MSAYERSAAVAEIRNRIDHPIVDADGHIIEYLPLVRDILVELSGPSLAERFDLVIDSGRLTQMLTPARRRELALMRIPWWGIPTRNTLDRATAMLPELLYRRLGRSASTSRSRSRPTGSPPFTSPTTSCGPCCRARSTCTPPRCTRRSATGSCRWPASRRSRRKRRSPSWSMRSGSSASAR